MPGVAKKGTTNPREVRICEVKNCELFNAQFILYKSTYYMIFYIIFLDSHLSCIHLPVRNLGLLGCPRSHYHGLLEGLCLVFHCIPGIFIESMSETLLINGSTGD